MKAKILLATFLLISMLFVAGNALALTEQERQTLIAQIQQQIAQLTQQLTQMLTQQQGTQAWCHDFNTNLNLAQSGLSEVASLHVALQKEGISYSSDGIIIYSTGTVAAVKQFQAKYAIFPHSGKTGPLTRAKLNQLYGCGTNVVDPITCVPNWYVGAWSACVNGQQTRTATDSKNCGILTGRPTITQTCSTTCSPNWQPSVWSTCTNGTRTRTVADANNCGITTDRPATTQSCAASCAPNWERDVFGICTCLPQWQVGQWSACVNGQQTRTATDSKNCGILTGRPTITQTCSTTCSPNWQPSVWSTCTNGTRTRTVADANNCGVTAGRPAATESCVAACVPDWQTAAWSTCVSGQHTRTVTDSNNCGVTTDRPVAIEFCTVSCVPNWQTGPWSAQMNSTRTRTVIDLNNCGVTTNKPTTIASIKLLSPDGGETFKKGQDIVIRWSSQGLIDVYFMALYYTPEGVIDVNNPINAYYTPSGVVTHPIGPYVEGSGVGGFTIDCRLSNFFFDYDKFKMGTFTVVGGNTVSCGVLPASSRIVIVAFGLPHYENAEVSAVGALSDYFTITP